MSENILKELCNRVLSLFKQTETKEENTKSVACNRLRVVLMQDRTNLTPELLQRMRRELVELLSKYVEMDKDALELNFDQDGEQMALMLSIPVIRAKDEKEIEKALAEQDEKEKNAKESENFESSDETQEYSGSDNSENTDTKETEETDSDEDDDTESSDGDESDVDDEDKDDDNVSGKEEKE